jgi:acyl-CoA reductase-like NAD-dependent aldehyde dehydrogenase
MNAKPFLIGSEPLTNAQTAEVRNPFTGETIAQVCVADEAQVEKALTVAVEAFVVTRRQTPFERAQVLDGIVAELKRNEKEFVELLIGEAGKPRKAAEVEAARAQQTFAFAAREALLPHGEIIEMEASPSGRGHRGSWRRVPVGVILGITPFNFPLNLVAHKVAPCIASGNTMLLKPALKCPLCALRLGELLLEAGMPFGQINVVPFEHDLVPKLLADERIKMVSFTGSAAVGWKLKTQSKKKRVTLELGGNAAVIVHEDARWRDRIGMLAAGAFGYAGQSCISIQRIFVHGKIYDEFKRAFVAHVESAAVRTGDPNDPAVLVGPMIDTAARDRVLAWVDEAIARGAALLTKRSCEGNCITPIILENVPPDVKISCGEAFGPVVLLDVYDDFAEALARVNDSRFGLQAGVFTESLALAEQAFETLDMGAVMINQAPTFRVENMPYGGVKDSGFGREGIRFAMEEMTEIKGMIFNVG